MNTKTLQKSDNISPRVIFVTANNIVFPFEIGEVNEVGPGMRAGPLKNGGGGCSEPCPRTRYAPKLLRKSDLSGRTISVTIALKISRFYCDCAAMEHVATEPYIQCTVGHAVKHNGAKSIPTRLSVASCSCRADW